MQRQAADVVAFLDRFLPSREECAAEYEYPQYAELPSHIFSDVGELLAKLEADVGSDYLLYWSTSAAKTPCQASHAIVQFMGDGAVVYGLAVPAQLAQETLIELHRLFQPRWGVVLGDAPPPSSSSAFLEVCHHADMPKIVDGNLVY